ncbi:MAG: glycoside hydrolase family 10 protein [Armatimonadota bacterium]
MLRCSAVVATLLLSATAFAQDPAVLTVVGRGAEDKPGYEGGGVVRFLDVDLAAHVIHYAGGEEMALPLTINYEVLEPAPIVLNSRFGTEYWRLYHFGEETMSAFYTREGIDLSQPGEHTAVPEGLRAWFNEKYGPLPARGLVGIRGHYYFLIDPAEGEEWLDITDPPPYFDRREVVRELTFTLADLSEYSLELEELQCTWQPEGDVRVRVSVTDARGDRFPVLNVPLELSGNGRESQLETEWGLLNEPTGWLRGSLPRGDVPEEVTVSGTVALQTPDGLQFAEVSGTFERGDGQVSPEQLQIAEQGYELPRTEGLIHETRGTWCSTSDIATRESVDELVERCSAARLNTIVADIHVRNSFMARSELLPWSQEKWADFDPLDYLIEQAHAAGLEVHPWFCVSYRDRSFNEWFEETYGVDVRMYDQEGQVVELASDVHRPEYADFMVELMVGVARDYDVDGIHLDYIRTKGQCYCEKCRAEFAEQFGKPLADATEEEWIAWQRQAIGDIVRRTAEGVREAAPDAIMSAAVFSNLRGGALQGQDPAGWAREGWIDVVIPMDYAMQTLAVRAHERQFLDALEDDDALVTGLSLYMRSGTETMSRPPELVREQIELVRLMGIHGYCLFAQSHLSDEQLEMLRGDLNAEEAVPYFR